MQGCRWQGRWEQDSAHLSERRRSCLGPRAGAGPRGPARWRSTPRLATCSYLGGKGKGQATAAGPGSEPGRGHSCACPVLAMSQARRTLGPLPSCQSKLSFRAGKCCALLSPPAPAVRLSGEGAKPTLHGLLLSQLLPTSHHSLHLLAPPRALSIAHHSTGCTRSSSYTAGSLLP